MALPSSGEIKISDILDEAGLSTSLANASLGGLENQQYFTINSDNDAANYPDGSAPASISEWYSYDHDFVGTIANDYYWDFNNANTGLQFDRASGTAFSTGSDISISFWVRPEWANSDTNSLLFEASAGTSSNRFFLTYDYGLNRLIARHRSNGTNSRGTHWNINSNSTQTGISSGKWHSGSVGNVTSGNHCHIVLTYDASASTGAAAFDLYWNGAKLPNKLTSLTATITPFNMEQLFINKNVLNTNSSREASYDNVALFHDKILTQSEITALAAGIGGTPEAVSLDDNVAFIFDTENDPPTAVSGSDYNTTWTVTDDNGRAISY